MLRTFDLRGRSRWLWRGWPTITPLGQHAGSALAITSMQAGFAEGMAHAAITLAGVPPGLRVVICVLGNTQCSARLFAPEPLSAAEAASSTLGQAVAVALPQPGASAQVQVPYTRAGQTLCAVAFVPGGVFAVARCVVA